MFTAILSSWIIHFCRLINFFPKCFIFIFFTVYWIMQNNMTLEELKSVLLDFDALWLVTFWSFPNFYYLRLPKRMRICLKNPSLNIIFRKIILVFAWQLLPQSSCSEFCLPYLSISFLFLVHSSIKIIV